MTTIKEMVIEIRRQRTSESLQAITEAKVKEQNEIRVKKEEFEEAFKVVIPMLHAENITYEVKFKDPQWQYRGFYVEFTNRLKTRKCCMDFYGRDSYRYYFTPNAEHAPMAYGKWGMNLFLEYIYDNLIA